MDGWWDCVQLDGFFARILRDDIRDKVRPQWPVLLGIAAARLMNLQSRGRAFQIGRRHYDVGNGLYAAMLDRRMVYSCAYWKDARTLDEAQEAKLNLVCRKLGLREGQSVLDIGCGWGSFAKYTAEKYGVRVVGVTVSREQTKLAREQCAGLPVEFRLEDYRDLRGTFNHVVSIGMIKHVGYKNYRTYFETARRCLSDGGLFLLQTIGSLRSDVTGDPWIGRYIFPNSMSPSIRQVAAAIEGLFVMEDLHNFGADYDRTLMAWHANFETAWPELKEHYDERFHRMWRYYLLACAGAFRARCNQLWQIVLSKRGNEGGYLAVR
jgi:cyclopropane-fatty-acyl-phospholipid synthase